MLIFLDFSRWILGPSCAAASSNLAAFSASVIGNVIVGLGHRQNSGAGSGSTVSRPCGLESSFLSPSYRRGETQKNRKHLCFTPDQILCGSYGS